jgi:DNA-3-methyladenine glycosylase
VPLLAPSFFQRDVLTVARELIGVELAWQESAGIIVETEAYAVDDDPACHTASRPSARAFVKAMPPGAAYIYLNYGMYWLFNLHVKDGPRDGLILVRALQPTRGIELMQQRRNKTKLTDLCSGPGKLALALGIQSIHHGAPMVGRDKVAGFDLRTTNLIKPKQIVADVRVGISQAADLPWRFLAKDNPHVSVPYGKVKPLRVATKSERGMTD